MKHKFEYFCKNPENIENYEKALADNFKNWDCHHRLETHNSDGERRLVDITRDELKVLGMYYNRPAEELIFMKRSEHLFLHHKGKRLSDETKKKMSEANKGRTVSEETRKKMGEAQKGHTVSEETRKKMSEAWDYDKHFSEETRNKLSEAHKGKNIWTKCTHWYNNGKINIRTKECPDGFVPGKLLIYKETEK